MARVKKDENREKVKNSLIKQLQDKNGNVAHFIDLVEKYLALYDIDKELQKDIKQRGVYFTDNSAAGHVMMKNNPSVKELVMVNKQMLSILSQLDLKTENARGDEFDEEL